MSTVEPQSVPPARPAALFSGGATLLVALMLGFLWLHVQLMWTMLRIGYHFANGVTGDLVAIAQDIEKNGTGVAVGVIAVNTIITGTLLLCVRLRSPRAGEYLGLTRVSLWMLIASLVAIVSLSLGMDFIVEKLGLDSHSDVMSDVYKTAHWKPLLWFALIVAAPIYEEIFMRGFLFAGWRNGMGDLGAILVISVIWTFMHLQYGPVQWMMIFLMGIVLGYARVFTGSLYAPIAMHALNNAMATIDLMRHATPPV